jgi:hypothetical protein
MPKPVSNPLVGAVSSSESSVVLFTVKVRPDSEIALGDQSGLDCESNGPSTVTSRLPLVE